MATNPFIFLDSFGVTDRKRFFGRNQEIGQMYHKVHSSNLILLYGGSGTGKTSLVMCGLANQFLEYEWLPILVKKGGEINRSLKLALRQNLPRVKKFLTDDIAALTSAVYFEHYRPLYLIFDQLEELYILGSKAEQKTFYNTIANILRLPVPVNVFLIIREEYMAFLSEFEKVVPALFNNRMRVEKMSDRNLAKVIVGTANFGKIELREPGKTVIQILDNIRDKNEGIDLTNLQVYLDRLWRRDAERQGANTESEVEVLEKIVFDYESVKELGKMTNALSEFLDHELKEVENGLKDRGIRNPEGYPIAVLLTLVTGDQTKQSMSEESILSALRKHPKLTATQLKYCLKEFERLKLLNPFKEEDEEE